MVSVISAHTVISVESGHFDCCTWLDDFTNFIDKEIYKIKKLFFIFNDLKGET